MDFDLSAQCDLGGNWRAQIESIHAFYSISVFNKEFIEPVFPPPNSSECTIQVQELYVQHIYPGSGQAYDRRNGGYAFGEAIFAHELGHAAHMQEALTDAIGGIELVVESLTIPRNNRSQQQAAAEMESMVEDIEEAVSSLPYDLWLASLGSAAELDHCLFGPRSRCSDCGLSQFFGPACAAGAQVASLGISRICSYARERQSDLPNLGWESCVQVCGEIGL